MCIYIYIYIYIYIEGYGAHGRLIPGFVDAWIHGCVDAQVHGYMGTVSGWRCRMQTDADGDSDARVRVHDASYRDLFT